MPLERPDPAEPDATVARPAGVDPRRLCQIEIPVSDLPRARVFYREAFGWDAVPAEMHEDVVLAVPEGCPFGIALVPGGAAGGRDGLVLYFDCDDPEAIARRAEAAGGRRRFGPRRLPGYGEIYQVEDPDGARFGLFQRAARGARAPR